VAKRSGKEEKLLGTTKTEPGQGWQAQLRAKEFLPMILGHALPLGKTFFALLATKAHDSLFLCRFLLACILPKHRLTATRIASCMRGQRRHRSNLTRFLRRLPSGIADDWLEAVFGNLLYDQPPAGTWIFCLDQTYCGHQSDCLENTFSTAHRGRRQKHERKSKRQKKKQQKQSYCHCFVFGLLLTPGGLRLPVWRPYYTKDYCTQRGWQYHKQPELAAQLIDQLRVPPQARVVVVGDTAFDATPILAACQRRHFRWVVAMNHDRRLEQDKPRPTVLSLATPCVAEQYVPVRLTPGIGPFVAQRRSAACRVGPKAKTRTFWVHEERCCVHNVGSTRVLFSTKQLPAAGQPVKAQKVLLTNDLERTIAELIEIYDLRWQVELFFKEMKGTLGLVDYRCRWFKDVEGWVNGCVLAFMYLEWYRLQLLEQAKDAAGERERWRRQRSYGLCLAVQQDVEREDIREILKLSQTQEGLAQLQQLLWQALPKEYRKVG
jgi:Transposase DDE domain